MTPSDCAAALCVLKNHAIRAALEARDPADMLQAQRDIVEGARRLELVSRDTPVHAEVAEYLYYARQALARIEPRPHLVEVEVARLPSGRDA